MSATPSPIITPQVTIANGASLSGATYLGAGRLIGIVMSSSWTTADITVQASYDGTNFSNVVNAADGAEMTLKGAAGQWVALAVTDFQAPWVKLRSGTSGSAVNQSGGDRVLTLVVRKITVPTLG